MLKTKDNLGIQAAAISEGLELLGLRFTRKDKVWRGEVSRGLVWWALVGSGRERYGMGCDVCSTQRIGNGALTTAKVRR